MSRTSNHAAASQGNGLGRLFSELFLFCVTKKTPVEEPSYLKNPRSALLRIETQLLQIKQHSSQVSSFSTQAQDLSVQKRKAQDPDTVKVYRQYKLSVKELERLQGIWLRLENDKQGVLREAPGAAVVIQQAPVANELLLEQTELNFDESLDYIEGIQH